MCLGGFAYIEKQFGRRGVYVENHTLGWQRAVAKMHGWTTFANGGFPIDYCKDCSQLPPVKRD